ncbi:phytanoyl-CoA dioxygenase, peroxisomal-like isoform X1 [Haliotis rubra]|uniref:phytanoyl-CoA dioxygenase, peroxisomal-like isoform X1 n=1 Tax=Haliotis rubra TaxID=36100 RepID=UPI001EE5FAA3|nr:phytanoyl-CoA dioxygenase, peroxisomal-like isoform X1 [Haliotis rubra]XP_046584938.1 phytanoyl-CoA dioxygenase, peroxisomal-like isoform X1 [Haliotis rubra]
MADRLKILMNHVTHSRPSKTLQFEPASQTQVDSGQGSGFTYSLDSPRLTLEQRRFYEENGYLVIKKLVAQEHIDKYRNRFLDICNNKVSVPGISIMRDVSIARSDFIPGERTITKIQDFHADKVLFSYCHLPEVLDYVECFTGPDILALHAMFINKQPDPGKGSSRHPMHQDLIYFPVRPADRVVCAWTAVQPVNRQNGCLVVLPGSHKGELRSHGLPEWEGGVNVAYFGVRDYDPSTPRVHLEMDAGDTVFFHPLLIHGSGTNKTEDCRKSISCHFVTGDMTYVDIDPNDPNYHVAQTTLGVFLKKAGIDRGLISHQDLWRFKVRVVRGKNHNRRDIQDEFRQRMARQ